MAWTFEDTVITKANFIVAKLELKVVQLELWRLTQQNNRTLPINIRESWPVYGLLLSIWTQMPLRSIHPFQAYYCCRVVTCDTTARSNRYLESSCLTPYS